MAFLKGNWGPMSSGSATSGNQSKQFSYKSETEALAVITASGYFNDLANINYAGGSVLQVNDLIYIVGSNGVGLYHFTDLDIPVTVAAI